jgi:hypothetical protein
MNDAFALVECTAIGSSVRQSGATGAGGAFVTMAPRVSEPNCMDAAAMSLELHGCGSHAV